MDTKGAGHRPAPTFAGPVKASGTAVRGKIFNMKGPKKFQEVGKKFLLGFLTVLAGGRLQFFFRISGAAPARWHACSPLLDERRAGPE